MQTFHAATTPLTTTSSSVYLGCVPKKGDKLWLSKYALTEGIEQIVVGSVHGIMVTPEGCSKAYEMGQYLHGTWDEAQKSASSALRKKIIQLEKQLLTHRKMTFKPKK